MVSVDADLTPDDAARLHEGLAHPVRVAAMRALREKRSLTLADLRALVAEQGHPVDTTTMKFHARKMEEAGLVDVGRDEVRLLRDVGLRMRPVPGA
jgi:DNA-binding transcriptional ArsR family regulator